MAQVGSWCCHHFDSLKFWSATVVVVVVVVVIVVVVIDLSVRIREMVNKEGACFAYLGKFFTLPGQLVITPSR